MTTLRFKTCALALALVLCGVFGSQGCATSSEAYAWPAKVVSSDELRPAEPLRLTIPRRNMNDSMPSGTAVLRVHVDELGILRKTSLETSSGNAALDSAAQCTLVGARFAPYREAGEAVAVTTLMPMNVRASSRCQGTKPLDC